MVEKFIQELDLLQEYMNYFINLRVLKEDFISKQKEYNGKGPTPRLNCKIQDINPVSFEDWKRLYSDVRA